MLSKYRTLTTVILYNRSFSGAFLITIIIFYPPCGASTRFWVVASPYGASRS